MTVHFLRISYNWYEAWKHVWYTYIHLKTFKDWQRVGKKKDFEPSKIGKSRKKNRFCISTNFTLDLDLDIVWITRNLKHESCRSFSLNFHRVLNCLRLTIIERYSQNTRVSLYKTPQHIWLCRRRVNV